MNSKLTRSHPLMLPPTWLVVVVVCTEVARRVLGVVLAQPLRELVIALEELARAVDEGWHRARLLVDHGLRRSVEVEDAAPVLHAQRPAVVAEQSLRVVQNNLVRVVEHVVRHDRLVVLDLVELERLGR